MKIKWEECRNSTDLTKEEYELAASIAESIEYYAQLTQSDFFLDCFRSDREGIVFAHGRPKQSLYRKNIAGEKVLVKNEPMVFYTRETGVAMNDAYAISQENVMVQQRTVAIRSEGGTGRIIGVLIQETDVTDKARLNDKISKMENMTEKLSSKELVNAGVADINKDGGNDNILIQETHHRIKNNLQTISSILNIQRRRTANQETRDVLTDNISRINSLAAMHEIMMKSPSGNVEVYEAIKEQVEVFKRIHEGNEKHIGIDLSLEGSGISLNYEKAQAVSMIVNELMVNAMKHGFRYIDEGKITVKLIGGEVFGTIIVSNDGRNFAEGDTKDTGLGFEIIKGLTQDKLRGEFKIEPAEQGTTVSINFPILSN